MDLMLPRLNALRDSEDEAAIAGAEYRHSTRLFWGGVSLKDDAKALGMGVSVKSDADMLNMGVIESVGSAHVVMSSQDKVGKRIKWLILPLHESETDRHLIGLSG